MTPHAARSDAWYVIAGLIVVLAAVAFNRAPGDVLRSAVGTSHIEGRVATVDLYFSPQDCAGYIEALRFWNTQHASGAVRVRGRLYGHGGGEVGAQKIVRGAGLRFPVQRIREREMTRARSAHGYLSGSFVAVRDAAGSLRFSQSLRDFARPASRAHALDFLTEMEAQNALAGTQF